ncbi:hypothetical protein C7212DRAFT_347340 [Tuber magnatum]|uniref:Uncharacterized protein n=1 Tax=Tuber magnatum TaxID=42249 RepID=A0A317SF95_9PEZI|nr:hypothetical protein C7212DRAFT_347340 [Tuber magnatum]
MGRPSFQRPTRVHTLAREMAEIRGQLEMVDAGFRHKTVLPEHLRHSLKGSLPNGAITSNTILSLAKDEAVTETLIKWHYLSSTSPTFQHLQSIFVLGRSSWMALIARSLAWPFLLYVTDLQSPGKEVVHGNKTELSPGITASPRNMAGGNWCI